jgi:cytochrome c553
VACHDPQEGDGPRPATSVPLPNLSQKYSSASLAAFLKETHKSRPSGRMPVFPLNDQQFRDLGQYLVKEVEIKPNVNFAVYHGHWDSLPKFAEMKPAATGQCGGLDLGVAQRTNDFGVRFQSSFQLEKSGKYKFLLGSDDGSRLVIDGKTVIDNDGVHPHQEKSVETILNAGWHDVIVDYMQGGGEWTLTVEIEAKEFPRQSLGSLLTLEKEARPQQPAFVVKPELAEKGKQYFVSLGCAACHVLHRDGQRLAPTTAAKPQAMLKVENGCLAEAPAKNVPDYHLSPAQRNDIAAALTTPAMETAAQTVHRMLLAFNCYACHERNGWGGVEDDRNAFFESLIQEMGDESRVPPTLTGVGDKLRDVWMAHLFEHSADDRKNYMLVKMPKFGTANVGPLIALFAKADRQDREIPKTEFAEPEYRVKSAGRQLVGGTALSCIKCHDFREYPSTGIRAISLTTMTRRLREEWFYPYMLNPQAFRRGTRMPAPWPNGQASIPDVLHGDTSLQMKAVWMYLADGDKAAIPAGLIREPIELTPTTSPIIYRNFIEGAGNRAICVGYPEKLNLAFDANDFRLALIWHGQFLDASRHWTGRGEGKISPLGDNLIDLGPSPSFARLGSANDSWPATPAREADYQFVGYTIDKQQRPTFRYRFGNVTITDHSEPFAKAGDKYPGLRRTLTLTGTPAANDVFYRAAVATKIEDSGDGTYRIDGLWTIRLKSDEKPTIRDSNGKKELLVPIKFTDGKAVIVQDYVW